MRLLGKIVRYALGIFCILIGGILFLGGMITYPSSSYPSSVLFMMFFSIAVLISGVIFIRSPQTNKLSNGNNRYRYGTNNGTVELTSQVEHDRQIRIQAVQNMQVLPVVEYPTSIILKPQEICYYQNSAIVIIIKNEVVGRTGGHRGASVRIARGLTVHTGGSASRTIRQDIPYYYDGILSITNQRVIMTGEKGFDYQIGKLTSIVQFDDAQGVTLQFGRYTHSISVSDPYLIAKIIELIQNGARTELETVIH